MANSDKNIVITPNTSSSSDDPKIVFTGANTAGAYPITLKVYPTSNGSLSFEGSAGQLFSITNSMSGTIYSVNDVSGIPSIEVLDTGLVKLAQYSGNVLIGTGTDAGYKLQINASGSGSKLFKATYSGGIPLYGYADGSGSGITNSDPYTSGALVYMAGTTTYLYSGSSIGLTVTSSYATGGSSLRAPLFYDSDNTGYYIDPASSSNLSTTYIGGHYYTTYNAYNALIQTSTSGSSGLLIRDSGGNFRVQIYGDGSNYGFLNGAWASWDFRKVNGGNLYMNNNDSYYLRTDSDSFMYRVYGAADIRSPIFYDQNNTGYYLDPNSTSYLSTLISGYMRTGLLEFTGVGGDSGQGSQPTNYGIYQQGGSWTYPYPDLCIGYHTGIKIGAHYSYNGVRFYNNSDWATQIFSVGDGDNGVRVISHMYAPIMYDYDNTGYYVDPASTTNLNVLYVGGQQVTGGGSSYATAFKFQ